MSSFGVRFTLFLTLLSLLPSYTTAQPANATTPIPPLSVQSEKSDRKVPYRPTSRDLKTPSANAAPAASSIARQNASVRRQTQAVTAQAARPQASAATIPPINVKPRASSAGWFSTPWPSTPWPSTPWPVEPVVAPAANPQLAVPASLPDPPEVQAACEPLPIDQVNPLIQVASTREGVREDLVRAVIERESAFRPCAVSPKGAQGLMQLMPATARELGVTDPFDPQQSVDGGVRLLKRLLDRYKGNFELALSAYNAGAGRVDREGGVPDIPETRDYVLNILSKIVF